MGQIPDEKKSSRVLKKSVLCFDKLSMNGQSVIMGLRFGRGPEVPVLRPEVLVSQLHSLFDLSGCIGYNPLYVQPGTDLSTGKLDEKTPPPADAGDLGGDLRDHRGTGSYRDLQLPFG